MYISTRGNHKAVTASEAICLGMVPEGGLFVPEKIPTLSISEIEAMLDLSYPELAERILALYLDDYSQEEIREAVHTAYSTNFHHEDIAPVSVLDAYGAVLELYHGPTAAFKDMALQLTPRLLSQAIKKTGRQTQLLILVATSGDTGKAALEGFKNVDGIHIACFFPDQGVSKTQELQMRSTDGDNTYVYGVEGNFDDCQNGVKDIFGNQGFNQALAEKGWQLSSANSINWGRLCPQIVYYFYGYLSLVQAGLVAMGSPVNFVVPTGNFGNILSGYYAKEMGLPIGKLICASNENRVLTDFFEQGHYDRRREFMKSTSPSMDILISSNLERFLFELNGHIPDAIQTYMDALDEHGEYRVEADILQKAQSILWPGSVDSREAAEAIQQIWDNYHYLLDTHTAVGAAVYTKYKESTRDETQTIIDATASPFKFSKSVLEALSGTELADDTEESELAEALALRTGTMVHPSLDGLSDRAVLHTETISQQEMLAIVERITNAHV